MSDFIPPTCRQHPPQQPPQQPPRHRGNVLPLGLKVRIKSEQTSNHSRNFSTTLIFKEGIMATGGFKSNATTDFLEEWKAKREKMRAKMLGDIAASTGAPLAAGGAVSGGRHASPPAAEFSTGQERGVSGGNCLPSSYSVARSSSASALKRPDEEAPPPSQHSAAAPAAAAPGSNLKKGPPQPEKAPCASPDSSPPAACKDNSDGQSPSPSKAKEKNSSGPSARKGKGQIEKRKLREKRRSTGVVSIPSNEVSQVTLSWTPPAPPRREPVTALCWDVGPTGSTHCCGGETVRTWLLGFMQVKGSQNTTISENCFKSCPK